MIRITEKGERLELDTPIKLPNASSYLWNKQMMIHMNCRGYAVSQFMQPEPSKYAYTPTLQAKTFMLPEQTYYAHHPGRFFYIKDEENGDLFSAPYEPVRAKLDSFNFSAGKSDILWVVKKDGIEVEMKLSLPENEPLEQWTVKIKNNTGVTKKISVYPYFPVGFMSWMNQSGRYHSELNAIVCSCITPYQKYNEYDKVKTLKDKTFFIGEQKPTSWEVNQAVFEGEGGLHNPSAISTKKLSNSDALYEIPTCAMQYRIVLDAGKEENYRFLFGAAKTEEDIIEIRKRYFNESDGFNSIAKANAAYVSKGKGCIEISTPDKDFDNFVNHWLPRQVYYHGETNRLSTDPQTRNYLQDNMGMGYIKPQTARQVFITALSQQEESGAMPDGILLYKGAVLKYINQVPHTDHCAWLPVCLKAYLDETNDYSLLDEIVPFDGSKKTASVAEHIHMAMRWLLENRDERGLNYIEQGDWNDPMNMVGPKGKGVSGWLTLATAYAVKIWGEICAKNNDEVHAKEFGTSVQEVNAAVNTHLWDGDWYARGITDDNVIFGIKEDKEGRIFLNPQAWALLSGAADSAKISAIIKSVEENLETPYGVELLGPSYTAMREDVGRLTQKHPGAAENGSVYNHAAAFYIYGLYVIDSNEKAYELLRKMIPGGNDEADIMQRGQLPSFIPNYYRGAYRQFPRTAGRSSQLFNTGTVSWVYRCIIEELFGLKGEADGIRIAPKLPNAWNEVEVTRQFRGAIFHISIKRAEKISSTEIVVNGKPLNGSVIQNIVPKTYKVTVALPF